MVIGWQRLAVVAFNLWRAEPLNALARNEDPVRLILRRRLAEFDPVAVPLEFLMRQNWWFKNEILPRAA